MKVAIQLACDPNATIESVLISCTGMTNLLSNQGDSDRYFTALLSNHPPISNPVGVMGLLLLPCADIVRGAGHITPEICKLYLMAVSNRIDSVLESWNLNRIDPQTFNDFMKGVRSAAFICARHQRSTITSSGILFALSKLASGCKKKQHVHVQEIGYQKDHQTTSLSSNSSHPLTPAHVEFLQCSILASQYNIAKQFIQENPIHSVLPKPFLSSEDFLRYHYLLGLIHLGCDDYTSAISAFQICLTVPSKIVSAITIEAMKKLILTKCLILYHEDENSTQNSSGSSRNNTTIQKRTIDHPGKSTTISNSSNNARQNLAFIKEICDMPKAVSTAVFNYFTTTLSSGEILPRSMHVYELLVKAYVSLDVKSFQQVMIQEDHQQTLKQDGNLGLAKQLLTSMQYRSIRIISSIYEAIPLSKLAKKLGFKDDIDGIKEVESLLLQIAFRQKCSESSYFLSHIDFTIESESSVVYFHEVGYNAGDDGDAYAREIAQDELTKRLIASMNLAERVRNMEVDIACSSKYQAIISGENPDDAVKMPSEALPRSVISEI